MRTNPALLGILIAAFAVASLPAGEMDFIDADPETGTAKGVIVGDVPLAHTGQLLPVDAKGEIVGKGQATVQADKVLDRLAAALEEAQSGFDRLVKVNVYAARQDVVGEVQRVLARRLRAKGTPAVSFVVGRLPHADALVAFDAVATTALDPGQAVKVVRGRRNPEAATSVAVMPAGRRVYVAGQAEPGKDLAEATRKTLDSLRATLKFLDLADAHTVQLKAFLRPMADVGQVRDELAKFFGGQPVPPVVFVEWQAPLIEIELIAWGGPARKGEAVEYLTPPGMKASPIFSRVARINHGPVIYVSGLYAGKAPDGATEVKEIFGELRDILKKGGSDLRHLVKATYYVSTDDASRKLNELRPNYYDPQRPPSASKAAVAGVGRKGRGLTIDMIAVPAK